MSETLHNPEEDDRQYESHSAMEENPWRDEHGDLGPDPELEDRTVAPPSVNPTLNRAAEKIGTVLGVAVNTARSAQSVQGQLLSVSRNVACISGKAWEKSKALREDASRSVRELQQTAQEKLRQTRERAQEYVHEKPFHAIAALAGVAFFAGAVLKIWRSGHE